jgi:hypothetical protein
MTQETERMLSKMVERKTINSFKVVCDRSNNTAYDIACGDVTVDVTIQPKAMVNFVYIPIKVKKCEG